MLRVEGSLNCKIASISSMRALLAAISCAMATALNPGVVLGLNGALQRRVAFDAPLAVGAVNRASESSSGDGEKRRSRLPTVCEKAGAS